MTLPLKIRANTTPKSLQVQTAAELDYTHHTILTDFASSNTGVGVLSVNPSPNTGLTLIGTFTDTYRNFTAGAHPIGTTITSVVYDFYQNLGSASETGLIRPVELTPGPPTANLRAMDDTNLNGDVIAATLANLVSTGVGSYAMQPTSPAGGTWVAEYTITNNLESAVSNVTYLWRKTAATAPTTVYPLKINAGTPNSLKEMSNTDIITLTSRLRNRIVATGIGTYKVQSATPTPGTWVTAGAAFSDTTRTASDAAYGGSFTGPATYTGVYSKQFTGIYASPNYTGVYAGGAFAGGYAAGDFAGSFTSPSYTRGYTGNYTATFFGTYTASFAGSYTLTYIPSGVSGPTYSRIREGSAYTGGYNGATFAGTYQGGGFAGTYTRLFTRTYTGSYTASYTGIYTKQFTGAYTGAFTGAYSGTAGYGNSFTGLTLNNDSSTVTTVSLWLRTA